MITLNRRTVVKAMMMLGVWHAEAARQGDWTNPAEVRHEENLCLSYRARLDGPYLVVRAAIEPGWHTFAMDNKKRAEEKLAGKRSLGIDHPTEITLTGGLIVDGPWYQSPPKDFSKPELRWFSWGFERQALFVAKVRRSGAAPVNIAIRGQACTETTCKNIDVAFPLPFANAKLDGNPTEVSLKDMVPVR
jgi:DsbC/DsbD-like thiol-disulfide interchange protein